MDVLSFNVFEYSVKEYKIRDSCKVDKSNIVFFEKFDLDIIVIEAEDLGQIVFKLNYISMFIFKKQYDIINILYTRICKIVYVLKSVHTEYDDTKKRIFEYIKSVSTYKKKIIYYIEIWHSELNIYDIKKFLRIWT